MPDQPGIANYLISQLHDAGIDHVFGVPGDYILRFYDLLVKSPVTHIGTTREDTAAFAADGYARSKQLGAVAITYGVGALSVVNAVAGAYAESSPVVVISGAPGVDEQKNDPLIHHRFGPFNFQREIFERITCRTAVLDDPYTAFRQIDRALAAAKFYSKPVYIELPRDMSDVPGFAIPHEPDKFKSSNKDALREAVDEALTLLNSAKQPVIVAGVEAHRLGLQDAVSELVLQSNIPIVATLTGKSVVGERHPGYLGIYEGAMGPKETRDFVEQSDLLLMLGVTLNDVDTGIYTANFNPNCVIRASEDEIMIRHHRFPNVTLEDFIIALSNKVSRKSEQWPTFAAYQPVSDFPNKNKPMTTSRLIERINAGLTPEMTVVTDVGDCLFASLELRVHERTEFLASAYYTSMGFSVPAALGAQIARPDRRTLVLVGDGAFQMTGTEIATHAHLRLNTIVVVLNNKGYSTERFLLEGPFNDIPNWNYEKLGEVVGPIDGFSVETEEEFEKAWLSAVAITNKPCIINVHLRPDDPSPAMRRLTDGLSKKV